MTPETQIRPAPPVDTCIILPCLPPFKYVKCCVPVLPQRLPVYFRLGSPVFLWLVYSRGFSLGVPNFVLGFSLATGLLFDNVIFRPWYLL